MSRCTGVSLKTADPTQDGGPIRGGGGRAGEAGCRMRHREGGTGVARLASWQTATWTRRCGCGWGWRRSGRSWRPPRTVGGRALEGRAKLLRQMLKEMRDLRQLAEGYYTRPRDGTYSMSQIYAPRVDSTKQ